MAPKNKFCCTADFAFKTDFGISGKLIGELSNALEEMQRRCLPNGFLTCIDRI
jgi:hypothetical protein